MLDELAALWEAGAVERVPSFQKPLLYRVSETYVKLQAVELALQGCQQTLESVRAALERKPDEDR